MLCRFLFLAFVVWAVPAWADTLDELISKLRGPNWEERATAANELARMGPSAKKAIPALVAVVRERVSFAHTNELVLSAKGEAFRALRRVGMPGAHYFREALRVYATQSALLAQGGDLADQVLVELSENSMTYRPFLLASLQFGPPLLQVTAASLLLRYGNTSKKLATKIAPEIFQAIAAILRDGVSRSSELTMAADAVVALGVAPVGYIETLRSIVDFRITQSPQKPMRSDLLSDFRLRRALSPRGKSAMILSTLAHALVDYDRSEKTLATIRKIQLYAVRTNADYLAEAMSNLLLKLQGKNPRRLTPAEEKLLTAKDLLALKLERDTGDFGELAVAVARCDRSDCQDLFDEVSKIADSNFIDSLLRALRDGEHREILDLARNVPGCQQAWRRLELER